MAILGKTSDAMARTEPAMGTSADPWIKQLLTQHLVVLAVAEAEDALEEIIVSYFHATATPAAKSLAESCLSSLLRSIKTSEIAGFLNRLGTPFRERFRHELQSLQAEESRYNNLVVNRHSIVHEAQCNITYEEFRESILAVHRICDALRRALSGA